MKRLLIFQHVPSEILGTLNTLLKDRGFRIRYVNFGRYQDARPVVDRYKRWLSVPLYQQELSALQGRTTAERIRRETAAYIQQSRRLGDRVFRHFLDLFQLPPRHEALVSR